MCLTLDSLSRKDFHPELYYEMNTLFLEAYGPGIYVYMYICMRVYACLHRICFSLPSHTHHLFLVYTGHSIFLCYRSSSSFPFYVIALLPSFFLSLSIYLSPFRLLLSIYIVPLWCGFDAHIPLFSSHPQNQAGPLCRISLSACLRKAVWLSVWLFLRLIRVEHTSRLLSRVCVYILCATHLCLLMSLYM